MTATDVPEILRAALPELLGSLGAAGVLFLCALAVRKLRKLRDWRRTAGERDDA